MAAVVVAVVFVVGTLSYRALDVPAGAGRLSVGQSVYNSARLFTLDLSLPGGTTPNAGLWVAAVLAALSTIRLILVVVGSRLRALADRFVLREHVVICGAGDRGIRLARDLARVGNVVIVLDRDPVRAIEVAGPGLRVVEGDAGTTETLEAVGAGRARQVVALTGDDYDNAVIGTAAAELLRGRRPGATGRRAIVQVQLEDTTLAETLGGELAHGNLPVAVETVSWNHLTVRAACDLEPREVVAQADPLRPASEQAPNGTTSLASFEDPALPAVVEHPTGRPPAIVVLGRGNLRNALVDELHRRAVRRAHLRLMYVRATDGPDSARDGSLTPRTRVILLDADGHADAARLRDEHPTRFAEFDLVGVDLEAGPGGGLDPSQVQLIERASIPVHRVFVIDDERTEGALRTVEVSRLTGRAHGTDGVRITRIGRGGSDPVTAILDADAARRHDRTRTEYVDALAPPHELLAGTSRPVPPPGYHVDRDGGTTEWERSILAGVPPLAEAPAPTSATVTGLDRGLAVDSGRIEVLEAALDACLGIPASPPAGTCAPSGSEPARSEPDADPTFAVSLAAELLRRYAGQPTELSLVVKVRDRDLRAPVSGRRAAAAVRLLAEVRLCGLDRKRVDDLIPTRNDLHPDPDRRVIVVAGGAGSWEGTPYRERLRTILTDALAWPAATATVVFGGTDSGVPGAVGDALRAIRSTGAAPGLRGLGYGIGDPADAGSGPEDLIHYVPSGKTDFSIHEPLLAWRDLVAQGVDLPNVRMIACPGGPITQCEVSVARALGVQIGWVDLEGDDGRAVAALPGGAQDVLPLPADPMAVRAFARPFELEGAIAEAAEVMARENHRLYVVGQEGRKPKDDPAMQPWSELSVLLQESNRDAARYVPVLVRALGGTVVRDGTGPAAPTPGWEDVFVARLARQVPGRGTDGLELLSEMEHGRWLVERVRSGWRYGARSVPALTSHDLVTWEDLSEGSRTYDRDAVRRIPVLLRLAECGIRFDVDVAPAPGA